MMNDNQKPLYETTTSIGIMYSCFFAFHNFFLVYSHFYIFTKVTHTVPIQVHYAVSKL